MGQNIVERTVSRLRAGGFRAAAACPGEKIPALTDLAVAVALHEVDLGEKMAVLEVSVLAPASLGAQGCQTAALAVGQLLQNDGASCTQDACEFDGLAGLFCVRILARYAGTAYPDDWTERAGFSVKYFYTLVNVLWHPKRRCMYMIMPKILRLINQLLFWT